MLYFSQGRNQGCCHGAQPGPSEWNYHWYQQDTGGHHPEGTVGRLDSCPIVSLTRRSGIRSQKTLPVKRQLLPLVPVPENHSWPESSVCAVPTQREGLCVSSHNFLGRQLGSKPNLRREMVTDGGWSALPGENRGLAIRRGNTVYWRPPVCAHSFANTHAQTHIHTYTHTTLRVSLVSSLPLFFYIPICQSFSGSLMTMRGTQFWGSSHPWKCRLKALWRTGLRASFPQPHQWPAHSTCARTEHNSPWSGGTAWLLESLSATTPSQCQKCILYFLLHLSNSVACSFLLK